MLCPLFAADCADFFGPEAVALYFLGLPWLLFFGGNLFEKKFPKRQLITSLRNGGSVL
jgi:hypothetical protein